MRGCSEVSARALRILRRVAEKQPEMFQTCLTSGLKVTADFHERIRSNYRTSTSDAAGGALQSTLSWRCTMLLLLLWPPTHCHLESRAAPHCKFFGLRTLRRQSKELPILRVKSLCPKGVACRYAAGVSEGLVQGLGALYMELVQPSRPHRTTFLANVLKPFDTACNLLFPSAASSDLRCSTLHTSACALRDPPPPV